jgi:hypothetical protein
MRKSLKIAAVAAVLFLAVGAVVFVYASSQNSFKASDDEQQMGMQTFFNSNVTMPRSYVKHTVQMPANGLQRLKWFLQNATTSTVQGKVSSEFKGMLALDTDSGQIRLLLPKDWTVDNQVVGRPTLFNGTFASAGESMTVKVLKSDVFSNANFSINVMIGYEAINATGTHAYAVLPFNIQPSS